MMLLDERRENEDVHDRRGQNSSFYGIDKMGIGGLCLCHDFV